MANKKKKKKKDLCLRDFLAQVFEAAGYNVEAGAFDDESGSWLLIKKPDRPEFSLELSFDYEGFEFTDFDVWKDVLDVVDTKRIF
jgi:hypothetical protein